MVPLRPLQLPIECQQHLRDLLPFLQPWLGLGFIEDLLRDPPQSGKALVSSPSPFFAFLDLNPSSGDG